METSNQFPKQYQGLRMASDILFRVFIIGYIILVLAWLVYVSMVDQWQALFVTRWHLGSVELLTICTMAYFTAAKFVLLMFALVPAIAIRLTVKKWEKLSS